VIASALAWVDGRIREEEELVRVATEELGGIVLAG
jgi:hypothetical protein